MKKFSISLLLALIFFTASNAYASETNGTIVSGGNSGYAWSNQAGWVNFGATNSNISVTDSAITGYAWNSNYGWINMAPSNGGVTIAANGALSGYAWGSSLGWINFSGVTINSSGKFTGTASGSIIGTLTFDCTNCSVVTDYRPANFRTTTTPTPTPSSGGGGGGGGTASVTGPEGQSVPAHLNAFNVPLQIFAAQSGTLAQDFGNGIRAIVNIPQNASPVRELAITVTTGDVDPAFSTAALRVVGGVVFNIIARDGDGNVIKTFSRPIQITFDVPEELQGRSDLGVYFFNEGLGTWEKISDATFTGKTTSFFVDHLTLFGIFSAADLPAFLQPFFPVTDTTPITPGAPIGTFAPGEAPPEAEEETLPAQLFDIRLLLDRASITRIADLVARVTFESFGRMPTPVEMTFTLLDAEGNELWKSVDTTTVQTSAVFVKRFTGAPSLTPGSYTARLDTLYNTDVTDTFNALFTVVSKEATVSYFIFWLMGGVAIVALALLAFLWWRRRKERETMGDVQRRF